MVSSGTFITTKTNYYNILGELIQTTDGRLNSIYYDYTDQWAPGTSSCVTGTTFAYPTKVTYPATVTDTNVTTYNACDGSTYSLQDQNDLNASRTGTAYTYDGLQRVTNISSPDGGNQATDYGGTAIPQVITKTVTIGGSILPATSTTTLDGLGRSVQTALTSDPDGPTYTATTYDALGRVLQTYNPTRCSPPTSNCGESTWGYTTNKYDALGRTVLVIPPDGTASADNVSTQYLGNCSTVTDQASKTRKSCTDAFGRLIEVDESSSLSPATPGKGTITISGSEGVYYYYQCEYQYPYNNNCPPQTFYDTGVVYVSIEGITVGSVNYGSSSTAAGLASGMASSINANSSSPVSAAASGATVTLTAITTGIATNYSLSAGSYTTNTQYFSSTSFPVSTSGAALTGGAPANFTNPYVTQYAYDALNDLTCAVQKGTSTAAFTTCAAASATWRPRSFTYDGLSRLLTASNPESGLTSYIYDANNNLTSKTSPKPNQTGTATVVATYTYDPLNRLTQKSFNDGSTPTAKYGYDAVPLTGCATTPPALADSNPVDASTAMCDGAGAESWSHDPMGRVLTDSRTTNSVTKSTVYAYAPYVDGSLNTLTYPSGHTMTYTPSTAERLLSAVDTAGSINYALSAKYAPQGALASLQNGGSLYSTFLYNNLLQPCWMFSTNTAAGAPTSCTQSGVANGAIRDSQYSFNLGAADNGNVVQIANRRDPTRTLNFTYDTLNRLATAQTQTTGVTIPNSNCWGLTFGYDAWGNLLSSSATGPAGCSEPLPLNVAVSTSNRIVTNTVAGQVTNYCYDAAGNLIHTVVSPATCPASGPYQYAYNAENHITSTAGVNYSYDGNGNRVMKSNGKLYWYGAGSDPLDETDLAGNPNNASFKEYVFFNGARLASRDYSNNVDYYFADHLGTARVITNAGGTILDDSDFYPFGVERSVVGPTSGNNYKFTGKERDTESYLDNFGARYYASTLGRFMSPDPSQLLFADPTDPQQLNFYAYARNNPLSFTDPSGLGCVYLDNNGGTNPDGPNGFFVDNESNSKECGQEGGTWFEGTTDPNSVVPDPSSNWIGASDTSGQHQAECNGSADQCSAEAFSAFEGSATKVLVNGNAPQEEPLSQDQMGVLVGVEHRTRALNKQFNCLGAAGMALSPINPDDFVGSLKGDARDKAIDAAKKGFEKASDPAVAAKLAAKAGKTLGPEIAKYAPMVAPFAAKGLGLFGIALNAYDAYDAYRGCMATF